MANHRPIVPCARYRQKSESIIRHLSSILFTTILVWNVLRTVQELTQANRAVRMLCAKKLLEMYPEHKVDFMWFTGEKTIHFCFQQWKKFQYRFTIDKVIANTSTPRFFETQYRNIALSCAAKCVWIFWITSVTNRQTDRMTISNSAL